MKADKELSNLIDNTSTAVVNNRNNHKSSILINMLPLISVLTIVSINVINNMDTLDMIKISIMTFLLTTAMAFYIRYQKHITEVRYAKSLLFISYLVSLLLTQLIKNPETYSFWMLGGLLIAMIIDSKLGIMTYFNHTFILSLTYSLRLETTIHLLVMGVLFTLLSDSLKRKSTVVYASIILLSTNITLAFILNNFIYETNSNINYLLSLFSIFAVLVTAFLLVSLYNRIVSNNTSITKDKNKLALDENDDRAVPADLLENNGNNENNQLANRTIRTSYELLLSEDNELILRMKEHSEPLYNHCRLIGDLSARAASIIGVNEAIAKAGGYYHEIGKIVGKNYIEEGLKLAEEYGFPDELREILKQHNIKHGKPTFVESAIVMISDNIVSTIDYIDKTGDQKFSSDKIVDSLFRMRMDKGTFDDCGLSVKDFKLLKEFYQKEFNTKAISE